MCYSCGLSRENAFALLLSLCALGLRLYLSTLYYLNPDEAQLLNAGVSVQWDVSHHPPLLLWWLWAASLLSEQEWWLRSLPAVCGAASALMLGIWLRRFVSVEAAWGMATVAAFSPNLVLLSAQTRGYSMALAATATALYLLDRAFAENSRRWLVWHFVALAIGILSEFCVAWVALATGLYAVAVLARNPEKRRLLAVWLAGQAAAGALYGWLYITVVRPLAAMTPTQSLINTYLRGAFPRPGETPLVFLSGGSFKQLVYTVSSLPAGVWTALLFAAGGVVWVRRGETRAVLVLSLYLAGVGALLSFFPFGRSRHSVVVGFVSLAAVAAGIDFVMGRWGQWGRMAATGALLASMFAFPFGDLHNIPHESWRKPAMDHSVARLVAEIPPEATLVADDETIQMLIARLAPRDRRRSNKDRPGELLIRGRAVRSMGRFDWDSLNKQRADQVRSTTRRGDWLIDTGFTVGGLKRREKEWGLAPLIDQPGMLYLARIP